MKRLGAWLNKQMDAWLDNLHLDRFCRAQSRKLAVARLKGRGGWQYPELVTDEELARQLVDHVAKGDPVDIANFCMFLHERNDHPDRVKAVISQALKNHVVREVVPYLSGPNKEAKQP